MARVLVVSRDGSEGKGLAAILRRDGHQIEVVRVDSAALRWIVTRQPDLLVLSVPDPVSTLREFGRSMGSRIRGIPAIAVLHEGGKAETDRDLPGLMDLLPMPFTSESFLARVDALLRVRDVLIGAPRRVQGVEGVRVGSSPGEPRPPLGGLFGNFARRMGSAHQRPRPLEPYLEAAASIVGTVEERDSFDPGHGLRVAALCVALAKSLKLTKDETELLAYAASVHDIGKIMVSAEILRKPTLTDGDRKLLKFHPRRGAELIRALTPYEAAADIILLHHERPDGKGYYGRMREEIPASAWVLAVADVYDGMTTSRSLRPPLSPGDAIEALRTEKGTMYDTDCVEALAAYLRPARESIPVMWDGAAVRPQ